MATIKPEDGQNNLDLAMSALGSLDSIVSFCKSNDVNNLIIPKKTNYSFDDNLIINKINTGYKYISG